MPSHDDEYARQIAGLLDQALTLIRQELVPLRNEVWLQKTEQDGLRTRLIQLETKKGSDSSGDTKFTVAIITALVTGFSALIMALINHFTK